MAEHLQDDGVHVQNRYRTLAKEGIHGSNGVGQVIKSSRILVADEQPYAAARGGCLVEG
jgi:hypothetical protein